MENKLEIIEALRDSNNELLSLLSSLSEQDQLVYAPRVAASIGKTLTIVNKQRPGEVGERI